MPVTILMPALSPTMEEGTLAKWSVKEGDTIRSGDVIAEIETDKATMEFEAIEDGVIGKLLVAEGSQSVKVNDPIAILLQEGEDAGDIDKAAGSASAEPVESAKAAPAPASQPAAAAAAATPAPAAPRAESGDRIFASPLARRLAAEKGLDLGSVKGSGPHGRIVKADVEGAQAAPKPAAASAPAAPAPATAQAKAAPAGQSLETLRKVYADRAFEEIELDGMRKTIAARLSEAKQTIPHFYLRRDVELDPLMALRATLNQRLADSGVKLSVNDFVIKASALALQKVPGCNAVWAGDRVLQFKASDVAVAVAIEGGLFTPVLRDAHMKSLSTLSTEMKDLAARARSRKLAPNEYQGGAFAISNLGMFGIDNFDAVINPPHASILAVGAGARKPVARGEEIALATVMSVTLSVDHRVIDGALGAQFLTEFKRLLEDPMAMLV